MIRPLLATSVCPLCGVRLMMGDPDACCAACDLQRSGEKRVSLLARLVVRLAACRHPIRALLAARA